MPMNYKEYPADWKLLSSNLRKAAGNRCELCWAPNGVMVYRPTTERYPWIQEDCTPNSCKTKSPVKIILTVHHIDSDKKNNTRQNLIVLCQRCHLRLDLQKHMKKRAEGRK